MSLYNNLKNIFFESYIKIPQSVLSWIQDNSNKIQKNIMTYKNNKKNFLYDTVTFVSPYDQSLTLNIGVGFIYDKYEPISFYTPQSKEIIINLFHIEQHHDIENILVHEFAHAIDPKNNKSYRLRQKSSQWLNKPHDTLSDKEFTAYVTSLLHYLDKHIHNDPLLKQQLYDYVFNNQYFPAIPNYGHIFAKIDTKRIDKQLSMANKVDWIGDYNKSIRKMLDTRNNKLKNVIKKRYFQVTISK